MTEKYIAYFVLEHPGFLRGFLQQNQLCLALGSLPLNQWVTDL
jgi:hypothetical protein